jgi:hypothetical protein
MERRVPPATHTLHFKATTVPLNIRLVAYNVYIAGIKQPKIKVTLISQCEELQFIYIKYICKGYYTDV